MKCVERKLRLSGEELSFDCELLTFEERYAVLEYTIEESRRVDELLLPAGTITLALYYPDRPYNLYYWIAPAGASHSAPRGGSNSSVRPDTTDLGAQLPGARRHSEHRGTPARDGSRREYETVAGAAGTAGAGGPAAIPPFEREIACYFNIAQTLRFSREEIAYRDLVVDLLVLPDGGAKVLDESELPRDLEASLVDRIYSARDGLLETRRKVVDEARRILAPFVATR